MDIYTNNEDVTPDPDKTDCEDNNKTASSQGELTGEFILPSRKILEQCLRDSFYGGHREEFYSLCMINFSEFGRDIEVSDRVSQIRNGLIDYCMKKGETDKLWSVLKKERSIWYDKYHQQWEKSFDKEERERVSQCRVYEKSEILEKQSEWRGDNVVEWFFGGLDDAKKSMVLIAALFQGVEKSTFHSLVAHVQRLLFPVVANEQLAENYHLDEGEELYKDKKEAEGVRLYQQLEDEQKQFTAARIKIVSSYRYGHFGKTEVDTVIFETKEYQKEILNMIRYNISRKKQEIFSLIYDLGTEKSWEKRSCAVNAVAALSETDNFNELVECIIKEWANSNDVFAQKITAESLSAILREGRHEEEIFKLLNSWINKNNRKLVITRLLVYFFIADKFPEESMKAIESAVYSDPDHLPVKLNDIAVKVYNNEKKIFISSVRNWMECDSDALRQLAGAWFLRLVRLKDAAADQSSEKQIVEIISALWKDSQLDTAAKVREWAEETLSAFENDEQELFAVGQKMFHRLYPNCRKKLDYYLPKWQGYREYAQKRAAERGKISGSQCSGKQANFFMLMPKEA